LGQRCLSIGARCLSLWATCLSLGVRCLSHGAACLSLGATCLSLGATCLSLGARCLSLLQSIKTGTVAHPAFYSVSTRGALPRGKVARTYSLSLNPLSSAIFKNEWSYFTPPCGFTTCTETSPYLAFTSYTLDDILLQNPGCINMTNTHLKR
jgi:hypothetical protein